MKTSSNSKKLTMTRVRALEKRAQNMARYAAFVFDYLDSGLGISIEMSFVQHGEPDQFYAVLDAGVLWPHEHLENLLELVKKHDGKLNFQEGRASIFLGRDA